MLVDEHRGEAQPTARTPSAWIGYGYAALAAGMATAARLILGVYFGYEHRFAMLYIAVLLSSWYGGLGPAVLAVILGGLSAAAFAVGPGHVAMKFSRANLIGLEFYFMVTVTVVILFEAERRARRRAIAAEEQLREGQKLESIGLLAGGIAHDFNNLLTGVMGNASLALEETPEGSRVRRQIEAIMNSAERAAELTGQLLAYAGKGSFVQSLVDFSDAAEKAIAKVKAESPAGVEFRLELAKGLPRVITDASQIGQMVAGLVMNAVEAIGDRPGVVTIGTRVVHLEAGMPAAVGRIERGEYVVLTVEDTGSGMDEATQRRIFDPFFTTKFMGRGLGLAAAAGIVRSLGGAVMVWSEPGRGTRVQVAVPTEGSPATAR